MRRSSRGASSILFALMALPLMAMVGLAVDASRAWLLRSHLRVAVDAAALAGGRDAGGTDADRNAEITGIFWVNFGNPGSSASDTTHHPFMAATVTGPQITKVDSSTFTVAAQATIDTTFAQLLGVPNVTVGASATAVARTSGLELALVLDNTGSMAGWPIQAVQSAATDLVNIVYGNTTQDTIANLWISVVPFSAEVDISPTRTSWLKKGSLNTANYNNTTWMGCVMARHDAAGDDFNDAPPGDAPFTPFLYPSTYHVYYTGSGRNRTPLAGDNDWTPTNITEANQATLGNRTVGPNLGCVALPILPETASRSAVLSTIGKMVPTYRGGTFMNLGLQAGWWTLSPRWRNADATLGWGSDTLPLDYNTPLMLKAIVLMTDGNNEWYSWNGTPPNNGGVPDTQGDADATAYGRLKSNTLGVTTQAAAVDYINDSMAQMCENIKANGIIIYTVLFNHGTISDDTKSLFQKCASDTTKYYLTPTQSDLEKAFGQIGQQLTNLRLSQ